MKGHPGKKYFIKQTNEMQVFIGKSHYRVGF